MWQMFTGAVVLFFRGGLFADQKQACKRLAIAAATSAGVACLLVLVGLPVCIATSLGGLTGGGAAPLLCRDLRLR